MTSKVNEKPLPELTLSVSADKSVVIVSGQLDGKNVLGELKSGSDLNLNHGVTKADKQDCSFEDVAAQETQSNRSKIIFEGASATG